jgi:hypothetical protein
LQYGDSITSSGGARSVRRYLPGRVAGGSCCVADIVKLVEAGEAKPAKRGPYKKRVVPARI